MTMLLGRRAVELVRDLRRSGDILVPYDQDSVALVAKEISTISDQIKRSLREARSNPDDTQDLQVYLLVNHHSIMRSKRCVLAYLMHRLQQLKQIRWEIGSALPPELQSCLGPSEADFFGRYNKLLGDYMASVGLDLGGDIKFPPKDLYIEVKGLQDAGEVCTESGILTLKENMVQFVKRDSAVDSLVRQGILQRLT